MSYINKPYSEHIMLFDSTGSPRTGEASNFTTRLAKNGVYSSLPGVSVTEVDATNFPGLYRVTFTPDVEGDFAVLVTHPTYNPEGWLIDIKVEKEPGEIVLGIVQASSGTSYTFITSLVIDGAKDIITASSISIYTDAMVLVETLPAPTITSGIAKHVTTTLSLTAGSLYVADVSLTASSGTVYQDILFIRP